MTDSSSDDNQHMTDMAGELIQAKMDAARHPQSLTHLLKIGCFHMEIVPSKNLDIEATFKGIIADLHNKFGDKILEIDIKGLQQEHTGGMHG